MNKMKEVAELLGVQLNEEFKIKGYRDNYRLVEKGIEFYSEEEWVIGSGIYIAHLLNGLLEIQKQILDREEKEYLETVLRPFKNEINIIKKVYDEYLNKEYLYIDMTGCNSMSFPLFKKGEMYKGMESDKEYTLKELGLFDE